jgi:hypothetical protein
MDSIEARDFADHNLDLDDPDSPGGSTNAVIQPLQYWLQS